MLAYYANRISDHISATPEGYLLCRDVPIARTGEMVYQARELQLPGDPDRLITVHRYPEDVFDPDAVASFEGKDVTAGHPSEHVGPENHALYSRGHIQNVRQSGDYLVADLIVKDSNLISDIRNNVMREISCGYLCHYVPDGDGYRQTNIRGNHVAVVPRGRAGHAVAIQDQTAPEAEKGRKHMGKFAETILNALGMAAHEAESPEEVQTLVATAATALDAQPVPDPASAPAAESVPAKSAADEKMDCIMEELKALRQEMRAQQEKREEKPGLDAFIQQVSTDGTIPVQARDAALAMLKNVQPVVAGIEDAALRTRVSDALIGAFQGPDVMADIDKAARHNARQAADAAGKTSYEQLCAASEAAYAARNPHTQKKEV